MAETRETEIIEETGNVADLAEHEKLSDTETKETETETTQQKPSEEEQESRTEQEQTTAEETELVTEQPQPEAGETEPVTEQSQIEGEAESGETPKTSPFRKWLTRIAICIFAGGALLFSYPFLKTWYIQHKNNQEIEGFEKIKDEGKKEEKERPYPELYENFKAYNEELHRTGQAGFADPWAFAENFFQFDLSALENEMIGYIEIPSIDVKLALYLGASDEHLAEGAAQISWSSVPIGGENTNSVIAAHRGYRGAPYFQYIDRISMGDEIKITNLWDTLLYEVTEIEIIYPNEAEKLLIREGKDMITLVSCHPYTENYQRYVVYAERKTDQTE